MVSQKLLDNRAFLTILHAILSDRDRRVALYSLCELYADGTDEQRKFVRKNYPFGEEWETPHITDADESYKEEDSVDRWPFHSDLPCDLPNEAPAAQRIRILLILFSIAGGTGDLRDDGLAMFLIYAAAIEIGMDTDALYSEIAALSGQESIEEGGSTMLREEMGQWLRRYVNSRDITTFDLEQMGFTRTVTPYGIRFSPIDQ